MSGGESSPGADVGGAAREPSPSADVGGGEPSPSADVGGTSRVSVQMWQGRAESRCRCGSVVPGVRTGLRFLIEPWRRLSAPAYLAASRSQSRRGMRRGASSVGSVGVIRRRAPVGLRRRCARVAPVLPRSNVGTRIPAWSGPSLQAPPARQHRRCHPNGYRLPCAP